MRIIKYYDRIHSELLELEVNDEVAKFFHADNRRWSRQGQKIKENIALSLDEPTEWNGEDALTYGELIEDEKANIDKIMAKKELARIVWNVVDKLDKNQAKMIKLYYIYGYRAKELANYFGLTRSAFTQWKDTTHKHYFSCFQEMKNLIKQIIISKIFINLLQMKLCRLQKRCLLNLKFQ